MSDPTECEICEATFDDEERASPETSGGWTMCDRCFASDWSHICGLCEGRESDDVPTFAVIVGARAGEAGMQPGVYQVLRWPWMSDSMFAQSVGRRSLLRVGDAPEWLEAGEVLCRECAARAIVRRTRSGRWRVTTVRWHRHDWRHKTGVYRTRALARRRALAYLHADTPGGS